MTTLTMIAESSVLVTGEQTSLDIGIADSLLMQTFLPPRNPTLRTRHGAEGRRMRCRTGFLRDGTRKLRRRGYRPDVT